MVKINQLGKLSQRAMNEQTAWDEGKVWEENRKIVRYFSHVFQCPHYKKLELERQKTVQLSIMGKDILEIGCFNGEAAKNLKEFGFRSYTGVDISPIAIENAKKATGMDSFYVMNGESLNFPDQSFDVVFGTAILHHLDWKKAIKSIRRVLRPGGLAFFSEPLGDNPISKIFRFMTPKARTEEECPVTRRQLHWADSLFSSRNHRFSSFFSMYGGALTSFIFKSPENFILRFSDFLDRKIEKTNFRFWMRYVFIEWKK